VCECVDSVYLAQDSPVATSPKHGNRPSGLMKDGEFLDHLANYEPLKEDFNSWKYCQL